MNGNGRFLLFTARTEELAYGFFGNDGTTAIRLPSNGNVMVETRHY